MAESLAPPLIERKPLAPAAHVWTPALEVGLEARLARAISQSAQ
jgi:hypothetical protein